jgi:hypothetical protein
MSRRSRKSANMAVDRHKSDAEFRKDLAAFEELSKDEKAAIKTFEDRKAEEAAEEAAKVPPPPPTVRAWVAYNAEGKSVGAFVGGTKEEARVWALNHGLGEDIREEDVPDYREEKGDPDKEDLSDLPPLLQHGIRGFGLVRYDVLGHSETEDSVTIVTRGGKKVRWPADRARVLTEAEKGRTEAVRVPFFKDGLGGKK